MDSDNSNEKIYPSVGIVYDLAKDSYAIAMKRLDVMNESFDKLRSWITTITLAFMAWILPRVPASSINIFFFVGLGIFASIIVLTIYGKSKGGVLIPHPKKFYDDRLHQDEWTFKKDFIFFASQDLDINLADVAMKGRLTVIIFILFLAEAALFGYWLVSIFPRPA
jgi:hypothetical protein